MIALEERVLALLVYKPDVLLPLKPFDTEIFGKWKSVVEEIIAQSNDGIRPSLGTIYEKVKLSHEDEVRLGELHWLNIDHPENYVALLESLKESHRQAILKKEMHKVLNSTSGGEKASDTLKKMAMLALEGERGKKDNDYCDTSGLVDVVEKRLSDLEENRGKHTMHVGIGKLSQHYNGLQPGRLVVVGANTGVGKTSFALTVASNVARQGFKVCLFSTEQPNDEIGIKLLSLLSGINSAALLDGRIKNGHRDWIALDKAKQELKSLDIKINDKSAIKVSEIAMLCKSWQATSGVDLVVIDYLTRLKPESETKETMNYVVGRMVADVKNISRDLRVPVILLSQLNRAADGGQPKNSNLRDSGIVEQEADSILLLHRDMGGNEGGKAAIVIGKNRHGIAGIKLEVEFHPETQRWY
jgi:replicative DNA helicase